MLVNQAVERSGDLLRRYSARFDVLLVGNPHEDVPEFVADESLGVGLIIAVVCYLGECLCEQGLRDVDVGQLGPSTHLVELASAQVRWITTLGDGPNADLFECSEVLQDELLDSL